MMRISASSTDHAAKRLLFYVYNLLFICTLIFGTLYTFLNTIGAALKTKSDNEPLPPKLPRPLVGPSIVRRYSIKS